MSGPMIRLPVVFKWPEINAARRSDNVWPIKGASLSTPAAKQFAREVLNPIPLAARIQARDDVLRAGGTLEEAEAAFIGRYQAQPRPKLVKLAVVPAVERKPRE